MLKVSITSRSAQAFGVGHLETADTRIELALALRESDPRGARDMLSAAVANALTWWVGAIGSAEIFVD